jgi:hypothetical protein
MTSQRGASCDTVPKAIWTTCYGITWVLLIAGTVAYHRAVASLIEPVKNLPANLQKGFDQELGFDNLQSDSTQVKTSSEAALVACGTTSALCLANNLPDPLTNTNMANTTTQRLQIKAAFDSSLSIVEKVANDIYLGIDDLRPTAESLRDISAQLDNLTTDRCAVTNEAYCEIFKASEQLVSGADEAKKSTEEFSDSDVVKTFEDNSDKLVLMHALPYVLLVSMLFFLCFWQKDAACCCCGGSVVGCVGLVLHLILWLTFFVISLVIVSVAWIFKFGQDRIEVGSPIKGTPTLEELLDHIQTNYAGFWETVVVPLEEPLDQFYTAAFIFVVFCVVISLYGLCVCLCRPYTNEKR